MKPVFLKNFCNFILRNIALKKKIKTNLYHTVFFRKSKGESPCKVCERWKMAVMVQIKFKVSKPHRKLDTSLSESHNPDRGRLRNNSVITTLRSSQYPIRFITQWASADAFRTRGELRGKCWNWATVWRPADHVITRYP